MEKTILVTGGLGYIGLVTTDKLICRGYRAVSLDMISRGDEKKIQPDAEYVKGNMCDDRVVRKVINRYKPTAVLHLAALTSVVDSQRFPHRYEEYNVQIGKTLVEAMFSGGCFNIVFSSSAAVYSGINFRIDEKQPRKPSSVYGQTKKAFEDYLFQYSGHELRSTVLRYFNVAGASLDGRVKEGKSARGKLIPTIFRVNEKKQKRLVIFGKDYKTADGTAVRDYVHVEDVASANVLALEYILRGGKSDSFNIGSGVGTSNLEVVRMFEKEFSVSTPIVFGRRRKGEAGIIVADPARAKKILGWKPRYSTMHTIFRSIAECTES